MVKTNFIVVPYPFVLDYGQVDQSLFHLYLYRCHLVMDLFDHNYPAVFQAACPWVDLAAQEPVDDRQVDAVVAVEEKDSNQVEVVEPDNKLSLLDKNSVLERYNNRSNQKVLFQILLRIIPLSF